MFLHLAIASSIPRPGGVTGTTSISTGVTSPTYRLRLATVGLMLRELVVGRQRDPADRNERQIRKSISISRDRQAAKPAQRTLSKWRHGFEPRWDYLDQAMTGISSDRSGFLDVVRIFVIGGAGQLVPDRQRCLFG